MEVKSILDSLNEYYKTKPYLTLAEDDSDSGSPSLNKMENCAYFGILKTLSNSELHEAEEIISEGDYAPIIEFFIQATIHQLPKPEVIKNEKIDTVLGRFLDKKSKRVSESRKELLKRFDNASFSEQKKIIKAFLSSNNTSDIEWAAVQADRLWDKSYADFIKAAFERKPVESLGLTIIRHMPIDYVRVLESQLMMFSRSEYCIRLAEESDELIRKYDLNIFEILYVKARIGGKVNLTDLQVEYRFFKFIYSYSQNVLLGIYRTKDSIDSIPWIRRALWALGELGYRDILMLFLQMNKYALDNSIGDKEHGEFYYAQQWMIANCFPLAHVTENIDFSKVREGIENFERPQNIKIDTKEDIDKYDDLPPDIIDTLIEFI